MARSTKGSSNRPATAGATTLPPAPRLAVIVTVPTQMLRHRSWHLRSVAANGRAGWVLDFVPGGLPQHLRSEPGEGARLGRLGPRCCHEALFRSVVSPSRSRGSTRRSRERGHAWGGWVFDAAGSSARPRSTGFELSEYPD